MTPSIIATSATASAPNPASTRVANHTARAWAELAEVPPAKQVESKRRAAPLVGERSNAWVLETKCLALRHDRLGSLFQSLLQSACIFLVAGRLAQ